jgi:hypothetical protein
MLNKKKKNSSEENSDDLFILNLKYLNQLTGNLSVKKTTMTNTDDGLFFNIMIMISL